VRQIFKKLAVANRAQAVARLLSEKGPTQPTSTSA
jgi:hypothetical protein